MEESHGLGMKAWGSKRAGKYSSITSPKHKISASPQAVKQRGQEICMDEQEFRDQTPSEYEEKIFY